jgi:hypothetical protein
LHEFLKAVEGGRIAKHKPPASDAHAIALVGASVLLDADLTSAKGAQLFLQGGFGSGTKIGELSLECFSWHRFFSWFPVNEAVGLAEGEQGPYQRQGAQRKEEIARKIK